MKERPDIAKFCRFPAYVRTHSTGILRGLPLSTRTLEQSLVCYTLSEVYRLPVRTSLLYIVYCIQYTILQENVKQEREKIEKRRNQMEKEQIIEKDLDAIYIGNLNTVDENLKLPLENKHNLIGKKN